MKRLALAVAALPLIAAGPADWAPALAPSEIVAAAPAADWVRIAPSDLMVMELAPDARGSKRQSAPRRVVIQLMPAPFSQGWVGNIRKLVAARWYDGVSVNRVQDNYVAQWGDANAEDPKAAKKLPAGLTVMGAPQYTFKIAGELGSRLLAPTLIALEKARTDCRNRYPDGGEGRATCEYDAQQKSARPDPYAAAHVFYAGWPIALGADETSWPIHCYGMVGVGRGLAPETGSGAELYAVIGHAPRHLDRNIALVGRVIEGIEHLSSLPRGTEALGFYKTPEERTPIASVRMGQEIKDLPAYEYLSTESASFARYAEARANRRDAFFNVPAGGADICNIPVPVRRVKG